MLTHAQIWTALDRLAALAGLSPSALARRSGLDPTTFNKSKRVTVDGRARWPSTESIARALTATDTTLDTFVRLIEESGRAQPTKNLPLIGMVQAARPGHFDESGFPTGQGWREIRFPALDDEHAYALEVSGDATAPVYHEGNLLVVSPAAAIRRGDRVVLKTRDNEVTVQEIRRRTARTIELRSLDPGQTERKLPARDVVWIARVVWASQ